MANQSIKINPDNTLTITLSNGNSYTLREPRGKDMDGMGQDLIKIKHTDTIQKLIQKISTPQLTRVQYGMLSLSDAQVLNTALDFFSAPPNAKAEITVALVELGYLAESESVPPTLQTSSTTNPTSTS